MKLFLYAIVLCIHAFCTNQFARSQQPRRPYRLNGVSLKSRVIWGAECRRPERSGLAFGGQDQDADDGRPHTRLLRGGEWKTIHQELRAGNPWQKVHDQIRVNCQAAKNTLARARFVFFQGASVTDEARLLKREVAPRLSRLAKSLLALESVLSKEPDNEYARRQFDFSRQHIRRAQSQLPSFKNGVSAGSLHSLHQSQIQLELAAEALDAEPPPRAMNCGTARLPKGATGLPGKTLVYDPKTRRYVIFGGDHLDYLTNDTWVFDSAKQRWFQQHPQGAPPPRANHRLEANVAADSQRGYGIPGADSTRRESYQKLGTAAVCCDPSAPFVDGAKYDGLDIAEPSGDNGQLRTHSNDDF